MTLEASYLVLVNDEGQYSPWPTFAEVPDGWKEVFGVAPRPGCVEFIEKSWSDMRPKSLIALAVVRATTFGVDNPRTPAGRCCH